MMKLCENIGQKYNRNQIGILAGILGLISNFVLFIGKFLIGVFAHSVSIMADAINSLSDTISSLLTLVGFKIAGKPADKEHPYGHERFEYVSGLIVSILVLFVGFKFLESSVQKIIHPVAIKLSPIVFFVLVLSIVIKILQVLMYRYFGKMIKSNALMVTSQDSLNDVYTTLIVLVSAAVQWVTSWRIDGYFGFALAIYILYSGYQMITEFMDVLLGSRPKQEEIEKMEQCLQACEDIVGFHDLLVHSYGPKNRFASVHIEVDEKLTLNQAHDIIDGIERTFKDELDVELVCHLDPVPIDNQTHIRLRQLIKNELAEIDGQLRMHDLRLEKNRICFDLVIPLNFPFTDEFLEAILTKKVNQEFPNHQVEITFDHNYLL
ncbi:cation diffusion facilitator family transporter [Enterococcus cecorum]|uniref:cation diffusion facilitator family transporter n=1 Tax=Enterococcus cecorum TaxID=44008 RepID=UPI000642EB10|nr:cation diffusion facilitator family transporter [Enterococcus cecorum]KLO74736.1 cation transporter [Enterococcus cecorum]